MASYYYLISSLPMLKSDGSVPMDYKSFLEACKTTVGAQTYASLANLTEPSIRHPIINEWAKFYNTLAEELNYQRNVNLGKPANQSNNRNPELVNKVAAVLKAKNPLIAEQMLLDLEFKFVDSMMGLHNFDEYYLFGYAIKLKLLERQQLFKHEEGSAEFESLFTGLRKQILDM